MLKYVDANQDFSRHLPLSNSEVPVRRQINGLPVFLLQNLLHFLALTAMEAALQSVPLSYIGLIHRSLFYFQFAKTNFSDPLDVLAKKKKKAASGGRNGTCSASEASLVEGTRISWTLHYFTQVENSMFKLLQLQLNIYQIISFEYYTDFICRIGCIVFTIMDGVFMVLVYIYIYIYVCICMYMFCIVSAVQPLYEQDKNLPT